MSKAGASLAAAVTRERHLLLVAAGRLCRKFVGRGWWPSRLADTCRVTATIVSGIVASNARQQRTLPVAERFAYAASRLVRHRAERRHGRALPEAAPLRCM